MHSQHYHIHDKVSDTVFYINVHHNGDYSGNAKINVREVPYEASTEIDSGALNYSEIAKRYPTQEIEIPVVALKHFIADYIRADRISELENATTDDILKP